MRQSFDERVARWMRRSNPGYLGGRSESVGPALFPQAALETFKMPFSASGKEYATLVVAADDSTAHGKASADYVCDGTADEVEINAAFTDLGSNAGQVLVLEGLYRPAAEIYMGSGGSGRRTMRGQGAGSVMRAAAALDNTSLIRSIGERDIICDLTVDGLNNTGNTGVQVAAYSTIQRVSAINCDFAGLYLDGEGEAAHCFVDGCGTGIYMDSTHARAVSNFVRGCFGAGIYMEDTEPEATANRVEDCQYGIHVNDATRPHVSGNKIRLSDRHGIWVIGAQDATIGGNEVFDSSRATDDTYSGIFVESDTNQCNVQGNTIRRAASGNQPLYGIRVDTADCDANLITNNDLLTSSKTGGNEFSDAGTGTVITAGNRT